MDPQLGSVLQFLDNKTVLVTGATGFLAKILVEKILRVQPNVKKLYVLVRAADFKAAALRFHNEVIEKDLFRVLKEKHGAHFNSLISEKITLVVGDITLENLGVQVSNVREEMWNELDVVINSAATTNFDQRYDAALRINTFGVKHVMNFAKKCAKLKVLVHVSTAYVCGERSGTLYESSYRMGETLNGVPGLDMDEEMKIAEQEVDELQAEGAAEKAITLAMKDLGIKRAKVYGWPNTYVFTKAMGEMVVEHYKENMPAVIIRPTIVTSTYSEPFPGWVEGIRTIDSLAVAYGQGKLTCFLGDINSVVDVIPADMAVNAILVAMAAHAEQVCETVNVYQVGSSLRNPMRSGEMQEYGYRYFTQKPWINKKDGKPVKVGKVTVFHDMTSFHRYMTFRYILPLKGLELANAASCQYFQETYHHFNRKINFVMRLVQVYRPYLFFNGIFDDENTEKLRAAARENCTDADVFDFDPKCIDWEDYFMNTHIPGIVKYVFK